MSKPKAAIIDIDDTCLPFIPYLLVVHHRNKKVKYKSSELTEWKLPEDLRETFIEYEDLIYASMPAMKGVIDKLREFKEKGYKVILMTARDKEFKRVTEFNLAMNGIEYDDEIYFNKNKALKINRLAEQYDIRYFADDKADTVNKVKRETGVKNVYLINMTSNKNDEMEPGVIRINNLCDIEVK